MIRVTPHGNYTLLIEFEHGNQILFNMERMVRSIPYNVLSDPQRFQKVRIEDKAICWDTDQPQTVFPLRLTVDNILFAIRD